MEDQILSAELFIGSVGYILLLISGPKSIKAAGRGKRLLPFLFRVLAVMVFVCHIKFLYFNFFGLKLFSEKLCENYQIENCTIAQVVDSVEIASKHKNLVVEFRDKNNHFARWLIEKSSEFNVLPEIGSTILVRINYKNKGTDISSIESSFLSRKTVFSRFLLFLSIFIIIFSIWIEFRIRKQYVKCLLPFSDAAH